MRPIIGLIAAIVLLASSVSLAQPDPQTLVNSAQALFERSDYEAADPILSNAIEALLVQPLDEGTRALLVSAYSLRARAAIGMGEAARAQKDFTAVLRLEPDYDLPPRSSSRYLEVLEETRRRVVGELSLTLYPDGPDAEVLVDGRRVEGRQAWLAAGEHEVVATRPGFRESRSAFEISPGRSNSVDLRLTKTAAALRVASSPPEVEVFVDGQLKGTTPALGALVVAGLLPGEHVLELRKACHAPERRVKTISEDLADWEVGAITLARAVGSLSITGAPADAVVELLAANGTREEHRRGLIGDLCAGDYEVTLRNDRGRLSDRVTILAGQITKLSATLRPALALTEPKVSALAGRRALVLGRDFPVELFAPAQADLDAAFAAVGVKAAELGQLFGDGDQSTVTERAQAGQRLSQSLRAQGLGIVIADGRVRVLAAGAAVADSPVALSAGGSSTTDVSSVPPLTQPRLPFELIDVSGSTGPMIMSVGPSGQALGAAVGDRVVAVDGQETSDSSAVREAFKRKRVGSIAVLQLVGRSGERRQASLELQPEPALISWTDPTLPYNRLILQYRLMVLNQEEPERVTLIRVNLGAALMAAQGFQTALLELNQTRLPEGPGVSAATVEYLKGLCYMRLGQVGDAEAAFGRARQSPDARVSAGGELVRTLAEQRLAELGRRR